MARKPTKAKKPHLAELDFEDEEPAGLGILDDDGNMVLRRDAKPKAKGGRRAKGKAEKPAQ